MEDLNTERMNLVPKLLYLNKVGYYLRCNLIEFFTEGPKKVNYSTLSSIMYTDEISQEGKLQYNLTLRCENSHIEERKVHQSLVPIT